MRTRKRETEVHSVEKKQSQEGGQRYSLRKRQHSNFFEKYGNQFEHPAEDQYGGKRKCKKRKKNAQDKDNSEFSDESSESIFYQFEQKDKLDGIHPVDLKKILTSVKAKSQFYKGEFLRQQKDIKNKLSYVGENSIPICADIRYFNWNKLIQKQLQIGGRQFDVIMMDPPWKLSSSQPSRGVAIQYNSLGDQEIIQNLPIRKLQKNGFLMIWAINAKFRFTIKLLEEQWGYKVVDTLTWVKMTVNGKIAKGHGFYLQHAKQTCIIGVKGNPRFTGQVEKDVIFSQRRGQSQKPQKISSKWILLVDIWSKEQFKNGWVTVGNQI